MNINWQFQNEIEFQITYIFLGCKGWQSKPKGWHQCQSQMIFFFIFLQQNMEREKTAQTSAEF